MNKSVLALAVFGAVGSAIADDFRVDAPVTSAVLYHNMAEVTRHAALDIPEAGHHRIIVPMVTTDTTTVRSTVEGASLLAVSALPDWAADDASRLQEQIRELELNLELNKQSIETTKAMMQSMAESLGKDGIFEQVQAHQSRLQQEFAQLLLKRSSWQQELADLQKQQAWQKQGQDEPAQALVFDVNVSEPGSVSLTWQADTDKAYWQPSSEWSLDTASGQLNIRAQAEVTQNTGMDWSDTALVLAVVPPEYEYPPVLESQVVRAVEPAENRHMLMESKSMADAAMPIAMMASYAESAPEASIEYEQSGVDFRVIMPGTYHLPNSKGTRSVTYWQDDIKDIQVYSAVFDWAWPHDTAMLMAEWTMPDSMNMLPGTMVLYRDGNRVTQMNQPQMMTPGSEQKFSFGTDPQLTVNIKNPPGYTENHGLISKSHELSQRNIIEVTNNSSGDKNVRVYSRLPVSTEEAVDVTPVWSPKPDSSNADDVKGLTLWQQTLPAGQSLKIESGFDIEYPEGKKLIGL